MKEKIKPKLGARNGFPQDQRLSTCTDCKYGIFIKNYIWTGRGLVHVKCEEKRIHALTLSETAL